MRRRIAWLMILPILVLAESAGHSLTYRLAAPGAHERALSVARTGHGYLDSLHSLVGVCLALVLIRLLLRLASSIGRTLAARARTRPRAHSRPDAEPAAIDLPRLLPLAHGIARRGPPRLA